jgi:hypothetical protein
MWAYYEQDADRILFRFRALGGRAWIDYVGFNPEPPASAPVYDSLGPAPPMSPPIRKEDGSVMHSLRPRETAVNQQGAPNQRGAPTAPPSPERPAMRPPPG